MKKSFVLVTRSYKYGGYCVAGPDAEKKTWIRLVSSTDPKNNEIPKHFFGAFDDLDILEVEVRGRGAYGCQTENYLLDPTSPPVRRGKLSFYELLTSGYIDPSPDLFGNTLSYLSEEEIALQHVSLGLFMVSALHFDYYEDEDGKMHYRSSFTYKGRRYADISVTDPVYRKDEFAGRTLEHALLAVSLPAIPYSNGKYYKFIAKIFPLTEEEATRAKPGARAADTKAGEKAAASHPHMFLRDLPDASPESASHAAQFLRSLSAGRDPDTDEPLDPRLVLSAPYAAWLGFGASLIEGGKAAKTEGRKQQKEPAYILRERIEEIALSDSPITASKLSERINAVREPYGKTLSAMAIGDFFLIAGMIQEVGSEHRRKIPTELGAQYGIEGETRFSSAGAQYVVVLYGKKAQQFLLDNLEQCAEILDAPLPASVRARLEKAPARHAPAYLRGKGEEDGNKSWMRWDASEQEELKREYSSGLRLEEIARRHRRTIAAVVIRLRNLGFEV